MKTRIRRVAPVALALTLVATLLAACAPSTHTGSSPVTPYSPVSEYTATNGKLDVRLTAAETMVPFEGGTRWAMTYNGQATGPTLRVHPGDQLTVTVVNNLKEVTNLHTHGLHVSPEQDNPFLMIEPGQSLTYTFDIPANQQAGTYWYHPHSHGIVAKQVNSGLVGAIIVEDDSDTALGEISTDRVLVVNDPPISDSNPWTQSSGSSGGSGSGSGMGGGNGMGGMSGMGNNSAESGVNAMTAMMGRTGPRLLTNGTAGVALTDSGGKLERIHLINASASLRLHFTYTGAEMLLLSAEGGRLASPQKIESLDLVSGERAEIVLVPGPNGGELDAQRESLERPSGSTGGEEMIASVAADAGTDVTTLPATFRADTRDLWANDVTVANTQNVVMSGHMTPTINGVTFDPNIVNFTAKLGTVEEWNIINDSPMWHFFHLHTWEFQVAGEPGWQDVVAVPPGETKKIRITFEDFAGTTVLHCHILDHEDTGMMSIIKVS